MLFAAMQWECALQVESWFVATGLGIQYTDIYIGVRALAEGERTKKQSNCMGNIRCVDHVALPRDT